MESSSLVGGGAASLLSPSSGDGTSMDTIFNIVNIAFGAGMLGLPYAIQGSGFVSGVFGMGIVLFWNFVCCMLLVELRNELLIARSRAIKGTPHAEDEGKPVSFAAVGSYAMGAVGTGLVYISVVVTLLGAAAAYFINANILLSATFLYMKLDSWSDETAMYVNTVFYMMFMYPFTCIKSLAPLSKLSVPAIIALVAGFAVIIKLGLDMYGWPSMDEVMSWDALYVPQTFKGFSSFFGVAVFSYGATIIILELQESMANTMEFVPALKTSLWTIWISYSVLGGMALLIYQQNGPVSDNIMEELPESSPAQEPLLLFITAATLLTYPLAMQPVASIFSQALISAGFGQKSAVVTGAGYGAIGAVETGTQGAPAVSGVVQRPLDPATANVSSTEGGTNELHWTVYYGLRAVLVLFTGLCATSVPNFGVVVALLGSFSVTLGSFVLPPLFHFVVFGERLSAKSKALDVALFIIGVVTCLFTTTTTAIGVFEGGD